MFATRMKGLHPYIPGEQPKNKPYIKLNANENPYPPSPAVKNAVLRFVDTTPERLALYPDAEAFDLRAAIAGMLNCTGGVLCRAVASENGLSPALDDKIPFVITPDMIYAGNGSDEVLSFVFYACFDDDRPLVMPDLSYSFYPVYAGFYGIQMDRVPLRSDWSIDSEKMPREAMSMQSGTIFANPNAPTGKAIPRNEVRRMIKNAPQNKAFVVDEAYVDFGGESCIPLLAEFKNLVIVRTFSKSMCGAGMRLGYLVSSPEMVQAVTTVKNSLNHFPVDAVSQAAGTAACKDAAYYVDCAKRIVAERNSFMEFLQKSGWDVIPSAANFVFAKSNKISGAEAYRKIKDNGILVRYFDAPDTRDYIRVTIGTHEQMKALEHIIESALDITAP